MKQTKLETILIVSIFIILIVAVGVFSLMLSKLNKYALESEQLKSELNNVPCWNEVCVDTITETDPNGGFTMVIDIYQFKREIVYVVESKFLYETEINPDSLKEYWDPILKSMLNQKFIGKNKGVYIISTIYSDTGSALYNGENGVKPQWFIDYETK